MYSHPNCYVYIHRPKAQVRFINPAFDSSTPQHCVAIGSSPALDVSTTPSGYCPAAEPCPPMSTFGSPPDNRNRIDSGNLSGEFITMFNAHFSQFLLEFVFPWTLSFLKEYRLKLNRRTSAWSPFALFKLYSYNDWVRYFSKNFSNFPLTI